MYSFKSTQLYNFIISYEPREKECLVSLQPVTLPSSILHGDTVCLRAEKGSVVLLAKAVSLSCFSWSSCLSAPNTPVDVITFFFSLW